MLAVVAIIVIILSILLPNLGRSRDVARKVICQSNLHQQGVAMIAYGANTQHYPGHAIISQAGKLTAAWPTRMRVYGDDVGMFNCPSAPSAFQWKLVIGAPGGVNAMQEDMARIGYKLGERLLIINGGEGMPFTYGYNDWGSWNTLKNPQRGLGGDLWWGGFSVPELRKTLVAAPSNMIAIADNVNDGNWDFNIDPTNPSEGVGKLHFDGANVLFADGHTEWELTTKWMNVNTGTTDGQTMGARWNNHNKYTSDQN
jgi:prepilin-type processing-associated H-X9-DG protein